MKPLSPAGPDRARGVSAWWYAGVAGVFLLGIGAAWVLFVGGQRDSETRYREATRAPVGQAGVVQIDDPGEYLVFYEGPLPEDSPGAGELADRLGLSLTDSDSGEALTLSPHEGLEQQISDPDFGVSYVPLAEVEVTETGRYRLETRRLEGVGENQGSVGVGEAVLAPFFGAVATAVVVAGVGLVLAVLMLIWVLVVRSRARRVRREGRGPPVESAGGDGSPGVPGPGQPAPPRTLTPPPPPGYETAGR